MVVVTTYTQQEFDLLVAVGMHDTQAPTNAYTPDDGVTEAVIEFAVTYEMATSFYKIKGMLNNAFNKGWRKGLHAYEEYGQEEREYNEG